MTDLGQLDRDFRKLVTKVLERCQADGFYLIPYVTIRNPWDQAKLYKRGRTKITIYHQVDFLRSVKAPFLADILAKTPDQIMAPKVTAALPGQSFHQWGLAVDCYVKRQDGSADWNSGNPGYQAYAQHALDLGLEPGGFWTRPDWVHIQRDRGRVLDTRDWSQVDAEMEKRFSLEVT
jgi:hypothetical protein